jgi:choline dehydrogenase-like flavoprotein
VPTALIIGSGPAAAGAALALTEGSGLQVTVIDIGHRLDPATQAVVRELSELAPKQWPDAELAAISRQPVPSGRALPEKRSYGSDFPFRDVGQLGGITAAPKVNSSVVSAAYGGFSNVWGSQFLPYSRATLARWPISFDDLAPHYKSILGSVPLAGEEDDLAEQFPLMATRAPLPPPAARTAAVLARYEAHRGRLNTLGITMGKARLALEAHRCVRCGLCMTGCPYSLIYSASQTFDELRKLGRITYHSGLLAVEVGETSTGAWVDAIELVTGRRQRFSADRVFVACGAVGSTRLVLRSLRRYDTDIRMGESVQFVLPFVSRRGGPDPRTTADFTLNQFNMLVSPDPDEALASLLHFYTYNPAIVDALPGPLRRDFAGSTGQIVQRLSVALGYLPSWASPRLVLRASPPSPTSPAGGLHLAREAAAWHRNEMLRTVMARVARGARMLDLWPLIPALRLAEGAKSYHIGSSFPHAARSGARPTSDLLGRVAPWARIHLVDASVFPEVPATTFAFTIMANAHRIATQAASAAA